jgi:hypothetical protein
MSVPDSCHDRGVSHERYLAAPSGSGPANGPAPQWQIAECLLPGLSRATGAALGQRLRQELAGLPGRRVSFLGSLLMPEDEVLLCLFAGTAAEVRAVSERAGLPFERIVACVGIGWRAGRQETAAAPGPAGGPA